MRYVLALVAVLGACALAGSARADGDPASDYLLAMQVFLPFDVKLPEAKQREFSSVVAAANKAGYKIRVALIASSYDLGSVTSLWRKPRTYARFLGAELRFVYKNRLLVVMPNGFGFNRPGYSSNREYALLSTIPIKSGGVGLLEAAQAAVQRLAAADGVKAVPSASTTDHTNRDRAVIILAAVALISVAGVLRIALRRKRA